MAEDQLISLGEAAARTGVSHSHIRFLARTGKIRAQKIGRDWLTTVEAVEEYQRTVRRGRPHKGEAPTR